MILPLLIAVVVGYLLGSLPFGYLVARSKGVNIFEVGSKNPGATNVRRVLGSGPGNLVFGLDALKGAVAASWALLRFTGASVAIELDAMGGLLSARVDGAHWTELGVIGLVGALVGHSFSCFTRFRGGKGVATSVGGLLILIPVATAIAGIVWAAVFYTSRYVSLASLLAAAAIVIATISLSRPSLLIGLSVVVALFVVLRHLSNIKRLLNGTENKFVRKSASPKS